MIVKGKNKNKLLIGGLLIQFSNYQTILNSVETKEGIVVVILSSYTRDINWHDNYEMAKKEYDKRISANPTCVRAYSSKGKLIWEFNKRPALGLDIDEYKGKDVIKVRTNAPFHEILYLLTPVTGEIILERPTR